MEKKLLYLECESGISGDMTVAALLDLGADQEVLERALKSLPVGGFRTVISRVKKSGLDMCDFDVVLDEAHENHDHDMEYLHGHGHGHEAGDGHAHGYHHEEADGHAHGHHHEEADVHVHGHHHEEADVLHAHGHHHEEAGPHHHGGDHVHGHRGLPEILHIIAHADLTECAKATAEKIFRILADAEAKAHGVPADQVHFHEVGAVDSIVDIVAAAVCLDNLGITDVIVTKLNEGQGTIRCQHGILPVPVPAVMNIVQAQGLPLHITETKGELVTPTGAAIVAAVRTGDRLPEIFSVKKMGMGAGKRTYDRPSMLRAMLIEDQSEEKDLIYKLETNIDDCTGESLGYTMERLMEAGARDVHYMPVYMKKNRPAYQLNVICTREDIARMEEIIFKETTTIGIRRIPMERTILRRELRTVQTILGEAQVKVCRYGGMERYFPEYNSVVSLCRKHGRDYQEVYQMIQRSCKTV
ncbi:MAG: nickel pincer cofactor biosynthesis protein LarC [Lachnospiraceae bacterium]|nr:nickel pincer cofactor biosynthesis protein LarC [Lachnospiraceae bacterium]